MLIVPIVQNQDRVIRPRDFSFLTTDQLLVTSVFRTIQGEGPYAGRPAVFVRLAGCNYGDKTNFCRGCDTSFQFDKGTIYTHAALMDKIKALEGYDLRDILVVTGGEPTLQPSLLDFLNYARPAFEVLQIETNGSQAHFFDDYSRRRSINQPIRFPWVSIVVSPKANLAAMRYSKLSPTVLNSAACLKFVLSSDANDPHHEVPDWALGQLDSLDEHLTIYVSPLAVYQRPYEGEVASAWEDGLLDRERTAANYAYAAQYAMKHNLRLSIQMHLFTAIP